jgi:hypothetical protein
MFAVVFKAMPPPAAGAKPVAPPPSFDATVDPETGDLVVPPAKPGAPANPISTLLPMMDGLFGQIAPETVPVHLRKLAGDLVIAAHAKEGSRTH